MEQLKIFTGNRKQIERKFKAWMKRHPRKEILFLIQSESNGYDDDSKKWGRHNLTLTILFQVKKNIPRGPSGSAGRITIN